MNSSDDFIECGSVRISNDAIRQLSGKRTIIHVPRSSVRHVELARRIGAERPAVHIISGALLVGIGCIGIEMLYTMLIADGIFAPFRVLGLLLLMPVGFWLIITAFTKKTQLYVTMENDRRKILFDRKTDHQSIKEFIHQARARYGYAIDDSISGMG